MKWKFISDSFYHMLKSQKRKKNTVLSIFIADFTAENAPTSGVTYDVIDELRRLSLSKCVPALCHKLIYEIAIFHSINQETCDKCYHALTQITFYHHANELFFGWLWFNVTVTGQWSKIRLATGHQLQFNHIGQRSFVLLLFRQHYGIYIFII